jgi:hypothetical protein
MEFPFFMMSRNHYNRLASVALLVAATWVAGLVGCNHGPPMARVRGKVHFKDGTIPKGELAIVKFNPVQDSTAQVRKSATGTIDPNDGSFEMNTRMAGDGVHHGDYAVTFTVATSDGRLLVAPRFARPAETPFKETINRNRSDLSYEIEPAPAGGATAAGGGLGPS